MKQPSQLLYAQVREDPEVDLQALQVSPEDRILAVTSGGCTALRLLAEGPKELVCVDFNPTQNYLLELKLAAIRNLPIDECRRFLGVRKETGRWAVYRLLAGGLSPAARDFWDRRRPAIDQGVLYTGRTETMVRWMKLLVFGLIHSPRILRPLLRQKDLEHQADFYRRVWNNRRWQKLLRIAFHPWVFRVVYGKRFLERLEGQDLSRLWIEKIDHAFTEIPVRSNYFLSQLFWGRFLPGEEGIPPYLRRGVFERVRWYADRLRWMTADLTSTLERAPEGAYTKVTLSNAFEWLPEPKVHAAFNALSSALAPGGRAVLRHLLGVTPLPVGLPIREMTGISDRLTRQERAFLYSRVSVYEKL